LKKIKCSECGIDLVTACLSFLDDKPTCKDHEKSSKAEPGSISLGAMVDPGNIDIYGGVIV